MSDGSGTLEGYQCAVITIISTSAPTELHGNILGSFSLKDGEGNGHQGLGEEV